jgi:hypothetical protein
VYHAAVELCVSTFSTESRSLKISGSHHNARDIIGQMHENARGDSAHRPHSDQRTCWMTKVWTIFVGRYDTVDVFIAKKLAKGEVPRA